jgi:hypothetical protein
VRASTQYGARLVTYAQNSCCGASRICRRYILRYQSNSAAKLLIYIASVNCFFYRQFNQSLDLQGFWRLGCKLSTKLSTEILEISKASLNQALSATSACDAEDKSTNPYAK